MKKIIWALFLLATAQVAIGQQPESQQTQQKQQEKEKAVTKKEETKASKKEDTKPATLDGKAFKITFLAKSQVKAPDEVNVEKNAQPAATTPDKSENKEMNLMGEVKTENKMPEGNTATGMSEQDQNTLATLDKTKGRLAFQNGMIRIDIAKDGRHLEECNYQVTTGSKEFGTFSGNCAKGYGIPSEPVGNVAPVEKTTDPAQTKTVATESEVSTDHPSGLTDEKDPQLKGTDTGDPAGKAQTTQPATPATTTKPATMPAEMPTTAIITGFVDGKSIKGTIIIKENGKSAMYSYTGILDTKKTKSGGEIGMK